MRSGDVKFETLQTLLSNKTKLLFLRWYLIK